MFFGDVNSLSGENGKPRGKHCAEMFFLVAAVLAFSNAFGLCLSAQVSGGIVSGAVMDASREAIPNVRVTLINVATRIVREVSTDATGLYRVPNVVPGTYEMTASAAGFTTQVRTDLTVNLGASLILNVVMQA